MNATCPECGSIFRVDPAKIPLGGVRARCSVCGGVIAIGDVASGVPAGLAAMGGMAPAPARAPMGGGSSFPSGFPGQRPAAPAPAMPAAPVAPPAPAPRAPAPPPAFTARPQPAAPSFAPPQPAPAPPPITQVRPAAPRPVAPQAPVAQQPPMRMQAPLAAPAAPARPVAAAPTAPPAPIHTAPPARTSVPVPRASTAIPGQRAPINPFLANDPNQKAKRLARALVSDIVAYFPEKHQEGLRDGTLRELFREEIKKSYEEYVDQMGKDFSEGTTHFQDALNDVLAQGHKVF